MRPHVSCLCVTRNRRIFLRQAVRYFQHQVCTYLGDIELVILDGSEEPNGEFLRLDAVRYFHEPSSEKELGKRLNRGASLCRGDIIVQWDDDDWQAPDRVARQVELMGDADLSLNSRFYWYDLVAKTAAQSPTWNVTDPCGFGSTFAYRKRVWQNVPFRDLPHAVDNYFWRDVLASNGHVANLFDPTLFIYIRHGSNVSVPKELVWSTEAKANARGFMHEDLNFYDELSEVLKFQQHILGRGSRLEAVKAAMRTRAFKR